MGCKILLRLCWYLRRHKEICVVIIGIEILVACVLYYHIIPTSLSKTAEVDPNDPFGLGKSYVPVQRIPHNLDRKHHDEREDIHIEDGRGGHHGMLGTGDGSMIAVALAITSKGVDKVTEYDLRYKFPFFRSLLPSLCKTSTQGYHYHVYVAYDANDPFFTNSTRLEWFIDTFYDIKEEICSFITGLSMHLIRCDHAHKPAWAQNDAMYEAYLDNMDYYYRVNDDSIIQTPGWTERFISVLKRFHPANVGVVGPSAKANILTYDFVHRTHLDIFGFHYPRAFTDWWGDNWITSVYQPGRSEKIMDSHVLHTQSMGTRYSNQFGRVQFLKAMVQAGKEQIQRYILALYDVTDLNQTTTTNTTSTLQATATTKVTPKVKFKFKEVKVIAMSLWGHAVNQTYGAVRNVNLAKINFPGWIVRIYAENSINGTKTVHQSVPERILQKLKYLGAEIVFVSALDAKAIAPVFWHYLVADDNHVDRFLIRDTDMRLSERDAKTVALWEKESRSNPARGYHCVRDDATHSQHALIDGLWGGSGGGMEIQKALNRSMREELVNYLQEVAFGLQHSTLNINQVFLEKVLWTKIQGTILCHDSVSCTKWRNAVGIPWKRPAHGYMGQKFDAWGMAVTEEGDMEERRKEEEVHEQEKSDKSKSCEGNQMV